jgi:hypothetical protein
MMDILIKAQSHNAAALLSDRYAVKIGPFGRVRYLLTSPRSSARSKRRQTNVRERKSEKLRARR